MDKILNHTEFTAFKNIGKKYDEAKVEQCIADAHTDLSETLGAFYFDVIKNITNTEYAVLLNGGEYTENGLELIHDGLKALVADYTYSRYLYEQNTNHSPFGMVVKNSQDSTPVDRNMIKDLVGQTNKLAARKWELIEGYLNANAEKFPVWKKCQNSPNNPTSFSTARFTMFSTGRK